MAAWQGTEDLEEVLTDRFQELPPPLLYQSSTGLSSGQGQAEVRCDLEKEQPPKVSTTNGPLS